MGAVETVVGEVRELIRRTGVDPLKDESTIRQLVRDAVADYDERSLHGGLPALADLGGAAKSVLDAVAGFGPLQPFLDDPTVEEIWINEPSKVFVARGGAPSSPDPADRRPGARPRRADAEVLRPSGRPVLPVRRRDAARRLAAARRDPGHHPRRTGSVNIRKFVVKADHLDDLVRLGTLTRPGCPLPRGGGRGRAQHPRRRRHAGRQDDAAELPCRGDPRARAGGHRARRSSSSRSRCATSPRCSPGSPAWRAPARSRCATGQGGAADAAVADHRRRGATGGVPRPAPRAQQRPPRHVHPPRQQRPRGDRQDVHPAAARRRERREPGSWCRRWRRRSTSSSTSALDRDGVRRVHEIVARPGRVENDVVETADLFVQRRRRARPGRRLPAAPRPLRAGRVRRGRPPGPGRRDVAGIGVGRAPRCSGCSASGGRSGPGSTRVRARRVGPSSRLSDELAQAGFDQRDAPQPARCRRSAPGCWCSPSCTATSRRRCRSRCASG